MDVNLICSAILLARMRRRQERSKRKRVQKMQRGQELCWMQPRIYDLKARRENHVLLSDLRSDPLKFFNYLRMSPTTFDQLLEKLAPALQKKNTTMRTPITPEERIMATVRFLSTGSTYRVISEELKIGRSTMTSIVREVCSLICTTLAAEYLPEPNTAEWLSIAEKFEIKSHFPNCVGALGSILVNKPQYSEGICSLLAVVDTDCCFVVVDVQSIDKSGDSNFFSESNIGRKLKQRDFDFPEDRKISGDMEPLPYVLVGDNTFSLDTNLMTPYPIDSLDVTKKIFNYRHSRAKEYIECAFAMMVNKWHVLCAPYTAESLIENIIKTCCILHNFVLRKDCDQLEEIEQSHELKSINFPAVQPCEESLRIRDKFAEYFVSNKGSVP